MLERLGFGREVLEILNQLASGELQLLKANRLEGEEETVVGVSFNVPEEQAEEVVINLQYQVKGLGYLAFINERDFQSRNNSSIGIIKSEDPFEILKIFQTNGENYEISNEDVVSTLKQWNNRYPFTIIGAGLDWVEVVFVEELLNQEMEVFAQEIYKFCPDIAEQE